VGAASEVVPKFASPSDPAAQWTGAHKGPAFFAYCDNYLIDVKFGVIVDVEASRSIRQAEVGAAKTMIERTSSGSVHRVALELHRGPHGQQIKTGRSSTKWQTAPRQQPTFATKSARNGPDRRVWRCPLFGGRPEVVGWPSKRHD
jgi:hypothetical protein